jgi:ArsR family transcriptional regulator
MATHPDPRILDHMSALSESARCRLLLLLEDQELTVSDLCSVLQLPQSTVSRHLKSLLDRGWVEVRPDRTRRLYHAAVDRLDPAAQSLWHLARQELEQTSARRLDRARLRSVLARQRSRSQAFFDESSDRWDSIRDELFGRDFYLFAVAGMVPPDCIVADLGCGTGTVTEALAPFAARVVGVDNSAPMLELARLRLDRFDNVELRMGDIGSLPLEDSEVDFATLILVLHNLEHPHAAIGEAARCLKPGGRILIVDMLPHDRAEYRRERGHLWLGFSEPAINEYLAGAGFGVDRFHALPPAPEAKGPNLFAATAHLKETME